MVAYATNLLSQLPLSLNSPNPFAVLTPGSSTSNVDVVPYIPLSGAPSCPIDGPMSCHNSPPGDGDSCCFVHPAGRLLLTQFWDREIHGGADEDWTIHGLWHVPTTRKTGRGKSANRLHRPDLCDGSYDSYCSLAPRFDNITELLEHHGQKELLGLMNRYWVANRGSNSHLWAHEYNKHATCINTLAPSCYGDAYAAGVEVVDYFTRAVSLFRLLDTYTVLQRAGIAPSPARRYPLADVVAALERFSGGRVVVRCSGAMRDTLHEVWYVYFVQGSLQSGEMVPAQDLGDRGDAGNCFPWVRYLPKVEKQSSGSR